MANRVEGDDGYVDYCSLAVDGEGIPHIAYHAAYYDPYPFHGLRYTYRSGGGWSAPQVMDSRSRFAWGCCGVSLALDQAGRPHIGYLAGDLGATYIIYARQQGSGWVTRKIELLAGTRPHPR